MFTTKSTVMIQFKINGPLYHHCMTVKLFGLGQVNGKLVAVGGEKKNSGKTSNEVYSYDERSQKWRQTIPSMPTAKYFPGVQSLKSILIVAGGLTYYHETCSVEIFKSDVSQWYRTDPLLAQCRNMSMVTIGNTCYILGGYKGQAYLNQALCASVEDLLHNAVPANQTIQSDSSDSLSAWKTLPNTPTYQPGAATLLTNNLLLIGGSANSDGGVSKREIYMYSPSTNSWIYVSDLPAPRSKATVAILSSTEILIIGGRLIDSKSILSTRVLCT